MQKVVAERREINNPNFHQNDLDNKIAFQIWVSKTSQSGTNEKVLQKEW